MKSGLPRGLPGCVGRAKGPSKSGLWLCRCTRCAIVRGLAVRKAGVNSEHPGVIITRAITENA